MNLSRRSLLFSLVCHVFLVAGVILLIKNQGSMKTPQPRETGVEVVSRPVSVKDAPGEKAVRKASKPAPSLAEQRLAGQGTAASQTGPAVSEPQAAGKSPQPTRTSGLSLGKSYPTASERPPERTTSTTSGSRKPVSSPSPSPKPASSSRLPGADWGLPKEPESKPGGEGGTASKVTRRARPTRQPEFNLTKRFPDLQSISVKAEFKIEEDGTYEPTLLTSTGNPTADVVILGKLLEFKWLPALEKGVPVKDVRVMDITLEQ